MGQLKLALRTLTTSFTATGAFSAGQPVSHAGALASANGHILGIALEDIATGDLSTGNADTSAMSIGECQVTAGGAITAGDYIKVGSSGKFLTADATAFAAGYVVGVAKTTASGDGVKFIAQIGRI